MASSREDALPGVEGLNQGALSGQWAVEFSQRSWRVCRLVTWRFCGYILRLAEGHPNESHFLTILHIRKPDALQISQSRAVPSEVQPIP